MSAISEQNRHNRKKSHFVKVTINRPATSLVVKI